MGLLGHEGYVGERAQELFKPRNIPPVPHARPIVLVMTVEILEANDAIQACIVQLARSGYGMIGSLADSGNALRDPTAVIPVCFPHRVHLPMTCMLPADGGEARGADVDDQPIGQHVY